MTTKLHKPILALALAPISTFAAAQITLGSSPARSGVANPSINAKAAAEIAMAIQRQIQPCADRLAISGPGASRIGVTISLLLNRDGSLAAEPSVWGDHSGVDDENRAYVGAFDRAVISMIKRCAPLRGLPPELYDVPRGWKTFKLRYKLPG